MPQPKKTAAKLLRLCPFWPWAKIPDLMNVSRESAQILIGSGPTSNIHKGESIKSVLPHPALIKAMVPIKIAKDHP